MQDQAAQASAAFVGYVCLLEVFVMSYIDFFPQTCYSGLFNDVNKLLRASGFHDQHTVESLRQGKNYDVI